MADQGGAVVGFTIFTLVFGGIFIIARTLTRTLIKPQFGIDDALIIFTWLIVLGYSVCMFVAVSHGFGKHAADLSPSQLIPAAKASIIGEVFAVYAYPSGKAAVACLLLRIFPGRKLQWFLWTMVALNAVSFYVSGALILAQCHPVAYQWDRTIKGGKCWPLKDLPDIGYYTGGLGAITDLSFAIVPWFYIANLKMPRKKKIVVGAALSAGLIPFVCSIVKIYYSAKTLSIDTDPTYDTVPLIFASEGELCAINIAACLPTLYPLYTWIYSKTPRSLISKSPANTPNYSRNGHDIRLLGSAARRKTPSTQLDSLDDYKNFNFMTADLRAKPSNPL